MVQRAELFVGAAKTIAERSGCVQCIMCAGYAACYATKAAKATEAALGIADAPWHAVAAARNAAEAATYGAMAARNAVARRADFAVCRDAIVACCKIGDKRPIELAMTPQQLCDALS